MFALLFGPAKLSSQPAPGSISTRPLALPASQIDAASNVYTAGSGYATPSYPVTPGAAQTQPGGLCPTFFALGPCSTAYVAKSDANGNLVFGTFLGGQTDDSANAVAVDAAGNVYIVGETGGSLPTTANAAIASSTTSQVFAAKISADGSTFLYVTYLPNTDATGLAIAVDGQGNAYLAGETTTDHAFIAKLNAAGSAILYNVTLPGTQVESATASWQVRTSSVWFYLSNGLPNTEPCRANGRVPSTSCLQTRYFVCKSCIRMIGRMIAPSAR
jgi:hypothetical protein